MSTPETEVKLKPILISHMPYGITGITKVASKFSQEIQSTNTMVLSQSNQLVLDEVQQSIQQGAYVEAGEIFNLLETDLKSKMDVLSGIIGDLGSKLPEAAKTMLDAIQLSQINVRIVLLNAVAQLEARLLKDAAKRLLETISV